MPEQIEGTGTASLPPVSHKARLASRHMHGPPRDSRPAAVHAQRGSRARPCTAAAEGGRGVLAKFSLLAERRPRPPPPPIYIYTGGPSPVAKIDSRRCCSSDLLPSSPSFPSSQPRARREGEEEIRRTRDGEEHSHIIDSSVSTLGKKKTKRRVGWAGGGARWAEAGLPAAGGELAARALGSPCLHLCSIGSRPRPRHN
jgi:hypothetical protein